MNPEFFLVCDCPGCTVEGPRGRNSDEAFSLANAAGWQRLTRAPYIGPRWLCPRCAAESLLFELDFRSPREDPCSKFRSVRK